MSPPPSSRQPVRPTMLQRAVSDMSTLIEASSAPDVDTSSGTRLAVGGHRIAAGSLLPGGGRAPVSPFLPLPPFTPADAANAAMAVQQHQAVLTPRPNQHSTFLGTDENTAARPASDMKRSDVAGLKASAMVRSYSMPVCTQAEFEARRRIAQQTEGQPSPAFMRCASGSATPVPSSHGGRAMGRALAPLTLCERRPSGGANRPVAMHQALPGKRRLASDPLGGASTPPRSPLYRLKQPRSPLRTVQPCAGTDGTTVEVPSPSGTLTDMTSALRLDVPMAELPPLPESNDYFSWTSDNARSANGDACSAGSGSEDSEVATPRASSPSVARRGSIEFKADYGSGLPAHADDTLALITGFIHPDHLAPPPPLA